MALLTRGKLARLTHLNPETIRFYERQGILPPAARAPNGYRSYSASAVDRIEFVGRAKHLGFSLNQIRDLLQVQDSAGPACLSVRTLLTEKLGLIRQKQQELERLAGQITSALEQCDHSLKQAETREPARPVFCCLPNSFPDEVDSYAD